jgi:hypothetical protein
LSFSYLNLSSVFTAYVEAGYKGIKHKIELVSIDPLYIRLNMIGVFLFVHTNEVSGALTKNSSNGWQRTSSTGISPSHGSHATAPIACDGFTTEISLFTLGLWLDGSIIVPIACRRHIGSRPILIANCISLLAG